MPYWIRVSKCSSVARAFARPHYSIATPDAELGPPGQKLIWMGEDGKALWGSHRPAPWANVKRMDGFEGHSCFIFRNAGGPLSSLIIREAVALTALEWGVAPFITYVAIKKVKSPNPGYCFVKAGFHKASVKEKTKHRAVLRLEMDEAGVQSCLDEYRSALSELDLA